VGGVTQRIAIGDLLPGLIVESLNAVMNVWDAV